MQSQFMKHAVVVGMTFVCHCMEDDLERFWANQGALKG
jgi:hypothetical protein